MTTKASDLLGLAPLEGHGVADGEIVIGFVNGIFGTDGQVRLHLYNRESQYFRKRRNIVLLDKDGNRFASRLKTRSGAGNRVLGTLDGPKSREDAHALRDYKIAIERVRLPLLEEDEFYLIDVIGRAVAIGEEPFGRIDYVHQNGPVDILEIDVGNPDPTFVPVIGEYIEDIRSMPVLLTEAARGLLA
mgnify:CR=1 FL=1